MQDLTVDVGQACPLIQLPSVWPSGIRMEALVQARSIPTNQQQEFVRLVEHIGAVFAQLAANAGVDNLKVTCVLADNFVMEIERRMRRLGESEREGFTTERVGGVVVGKNLPQKEDDSEVAIVFAPELWVADGFDAYRVAVVAHE